MNIWETFILFFSFQSVIFGTILFLKKKGNTTSHYIWGSFLFLFAYNIFFNVLFWSKVNPRLLLLLQSSYMFCMALYGPLFYLYIRSLIKEQNLNWKDTVHFIPFLLALHHCGGFLFRSPEVKKEIIKNGQFQDVLVYGPYFEYLLVLIMVGYGIAALFIFRKATKRESSDVYTWLKAITGTYIAFCLSWVVYYILVREKILLTEHDYIITFFMIVFISITTYVGIEHPSIFNGKPFKELVPFVKYEKTGLSKRRSLEWKKKLETFMEKEKPYLNAELTLDDITSPDYR